MNEEKDLVRSGIDPYAPIDFAALRKAIAEKGPLRLSQPNLPYTVTIDIEPCLCASEGCTAILVPVWRKHGVFTMHWLLSQEDLEKYDCLNSLLDAAVVADIIDSRGERLLVETQAAATFGMPYHKVPVTTCFCGRDGKNLEQEPLSKVMLLSQLSRLLAERDEMMGVATEHDNDVGADVVAGIFDLGYAAGRIFSEWAVKETIEADVIEGRKAAETKERRSKAAGERSAKDRAERWGQLLDEMEALIKGSPALARLDVSQIVKVAVEDASKGKPDLWKQGSGQAEEYLGEIRRGEAGADMKARLEAILPPKPFKRFR